MGRSKPLDGRRHRRRALLSGWLAGLLISAVPLGLAGCGSKPPLLSATYTVTAWLDVQAAVDSARSGDVIDLSRLWSPDVQYTIQVPKNLELKLVGPKGVMLYGVAFELGGRNSLTIQDLSITAANNQASAALAFTGKGNSLTLAGSNVIRNSPAAGKAGFGAGVGVPDGVELLISGQGSLSASGASGGAALGGGEGKAAGSITIDLDEVGSLSVSTSGDGAGIGGGGGGAGGSIAILGGKVTVLGGGGLPTPDGSLPATAGAGIGGGKDGAAATVRIEGGSVSVSVNSSGAALGGGAGGAGGELNINGGNVSCQNKGPGPALGGGVGGTPGKMTMRGGSLYAEGQAQAANGSFSELPAAYHWKTDTSPAGEAEMAYPGDAFTLSEGNKRLQVATAEVLSISVSPAAAEVPRGGEQGFTASVLSTGGANASFRWSISGQSSQSTFIDSEGTLIVAANESAATITVKATSIFNSDVVGEATVTVLPAPSSAH